jgi:fructose-1-phosphate kinase PfkB-like protein
MIVTVTPNPSTDRTVRSVPVTEAVRTNIAITENNGTTTKLNRPGANLDTAAVAALTRAVVDRAEHAWWVVMSGSLRPGVPDGWYAEVVSLLASMAPTRSRSSANLSDCWPTA